MVVKLVHFFIEQSLFCAAERGFILDKLGLKKLKDLVDLSISVN